MTTQFDMLCIGGGLAGLTAATRARELGLRVVLAEAGSGEHYPCNSRVAGGILHVSYHDVAKPPEQLREAMWGQDVTDSPQAQAMATTAGRAFNWLRGQGIRIANFPQLKRGAWVLAPPRPMVTEIQSPDAWQGRGPDRALKTLRHRFATLGGTFLESTKARELLMSGDRCVGARVQTPHGMQDLHAQNTLLADGGFAFNPQRFRQYIGPNPEEVLQRNARSNHGDALIMAEAVGAQLIGMNRFYGHLLSRDALHNPKLWPYPQTDALAAAGIVVDAAGQRFFDEGLGGIYAANHLATLTRPSSTQIIIDSAIWHGPGRIGLVAPNPMLPHHGGTFHQASNFAELAKLAGLPENSLINTIEQYNAALSQGQLDSLSPARTQRKAQAMPILTAPFMAIPICSGITNTMGGLAIDAEGRVLATDDHVIPGLYAAGAATGGLEGGPPVAYVGGLMKAVVFGLRAAEHAARVAVPNS